MQNLKSRIANLTRRDEQGVSLVEILIYITILAVLLTGVIALVISSTNASSRLTTTTATQAEVNNTQASLVRDLSLTQNIYEAGGDHIQFSVMQNNKNYRITIFSYGGQTERGNVPDYIDNILSNNPNLNNALPAEPAIMSIREEYGNPTAKTITALTKGYDPEAYAHRDLWLFSYYDKDNELIPFADDKQFTNPKQDINKIVRISFRVAADAPGRASKVQAESSVTPPLKKTNISGNLNDPSTNPDVGNDNLACPILEASIPRNSRAAIIDWRQVTGITQIYITRSEYRNSTWTTQTTYTIDNPSLTTFTEPANSLVIGGTYKYSMTIETVRGQTDCGETDPVSVIPATSPLRNINVNAYSGTSNLTGVNTAGTATTMSNAISVRNITRSATTAQPLAGARYTVARDLTNQLSWSGTYGANEYLIYRNGTHIGTVAAKTTGSSTQEGTQTYFYTDTGRAFGNVSDYQIVARNNGGNNPDQTLDGYAVFLNSHSLISPPTPSSTYSVVANDTEVASNGNVLSSNTITVRATDNVVGFRAKYASSETAADCAVGIPQTDVDGTSAAGYRYDDNISLMANAGFLSTVNASELTQTGVSWGTTTCYRMIPFNDAGSYTYNEGANNTTARVKANQNPERFKLNSVDSGSYFYNVDYSENARLYDPFYSDVSGRSDCLLYSGPHKNQFGTDEVFCDGNPNKTYSGGPWGTGNWSPIGGIIPRPNQHQMFRNQNQHQIYGTQQEIISRWDVSRGARAGYSLNRKVEDAPSGRGSISGYSNNRTEAIPFATGNSTNNGIRFSGEFPGVVMSISVDSKAMNGLTRTGIAKNTTSNPKFMFATNPAPSLQIRAGYFRGYTGPGTTSASNEMNRPSHGYGGRAYLTAYIGGYNVANNVSADVTNSAYRFMTAGRPIGQVELYRNINWSSPYGSKTSSTFLGTGVFYGSGGPYGWWPERYPQYWGNMSGRYTGKSTLSANSSSNSYWPNDRIILKSGDTIPPFSNEIGSTDLPSNNHGCAAIEESFEGYEEIGCEYGAGIAPAVANIIAERTGASTYKISWDATQGATSYRVKVFKGTTEVMNTVSNATNVSLPNVTAPGTVYRVEVRAINSAGESANFGEISFTASPTPGSITNLNITKQSATSYLASWTASANATSYRVQVFDGATQIQDSTAATTTRNITGITNNGKTYRVVVTAINLAGNSSSIEKTFTTDLPTAPAGTLTMSLTTNNTANAYSPSGATGISGMTCPTGVLENQVKYGSTVIRTWGTATNFAIPSTFPKGVSTAILVDFRCNDGGNLSAVKTMTGPSATYQRNAPIVGVPGALNVTASVIKPGTSGGSYIVPAGIPVKFTAPAATCGTGWTPSYKFVSSQNGQASSQTITALNSLDLMNLNSNSNGTANYSVACKNSTTGEMSKYSGSSTNATVSASSFTIPAPSSAPTVSNSSPVAGSKIVVTMQNHASICPSGSTPLYLLWAHGWIPEPAESTTNTIEITPDATTVSDGIWYYVECKVGSIVVGGSADISPVRTGITIITTPAVPGMPTVSSLFDQKASLTWGASARATSYEVKIISKNGSVREAVSTAPSATVVYPSARPGDSVSFQVRAKNAAGYSNYSAVRTVKALVGDYTSDGNPDLLTHLNTTGEARIYKGYGDGGLTLQNSIGSGWNEYSPKGDVDVNNDGRLDFVSYSRPSASFYIYTYPGIPNATSGSRTTVKTGISNAVFLGVYDTNADGNMDIVYSQGASISRLLGDGNGNFGNPTVIANTGATITMLAGIGDFNGDGHTDIVVKHSTYLTMWIASPTGILTKSMQTGSGWNAVTHLGTADLNGDGRSDLLTRVNGGLRVYYHPTSNVSVDFTGASFGTSWDTWNRFATMKDYNKDGTLDLIAINNLSSGSLPGKLYFYAGSNSLSFVSSGVEKGTGWTGMSLWNDYY